MSENPKYQSQDHKVWSAIEDFALHTEDEITAMSDDELDAHLAQEGIDVKSRFEELHARIAYAKGQARLRIARENRIRAEQTSKQAERNTSNTLTKKRDFSYLDTAALQAQIMSKVGGNQTAALFRRMEGASDDDLRAILEDLDELDSSSEAAEN